METQDNNATQELNGTGEAHGAQPLSVDDRVAALAAHTHRALTSLKNRIEKLDAEVLELRSDLVGLDVRIASLESSVSTTTEQLNTALTILRDFELDTTLRQALEAQVNALTLKTKAGFEHLGVNVDNLSGRSRR